MCEGNAGEVGDAVKDGLGVHGGLRTRILRMFKDFKDGCCLFGVSVDCCAVVFDFVGLRELGWVTWSNRHQYAFVCCC